MAMTMADKKRQADNAYWRYLASSKYSLSDAYKNPSKEKQSAFTFWKNKCASQYGTNFKIIGHNCMMFSLGYEYLADNGKEMFRYITANYHIDVPVEEMYERMRKKLREKSKADRG